MIELKQQKVSSRPKFDLTSLLEMKVAVSRKKESFTPSIYSIARITNDIDKSRCCRENCYCEDDCSCHNHCGTYCWCDYECECEGDACRMDNS